MIGHPVPLRQRRELSQIMETAFNLYGQNFGPLFRIAAIVVPLGIAVGIFQSTVKGDFGLALVGALGVGQVAVNLLGSAALIATVQDIEAGRPPDFTRAYDIATERFWTLLGAALRVTFHVLLFAVTIIGIPWAIQRFVRWVFIEQAIVLDGTNAKDALSQSARAVAGRWWRTFGIWLLITILAALPAGVVAGLFSFTPVAVSSVATALIEAVMLPFVVLATTLLYFDLNARKESHALVSVA